MHHVSPPSLEDVHQAVQTLLRWAGDNPDREGLQDTPDRVARAYREFFAGYRQDPAALLSATFEEAGDYDDMVTVRCIDFVSHCEHHMVPIVGQVHIAYLPANRVVGLSKLARVVDVFARRLQIQERMTSQIADCIFDALRPRALAVVVCAQHMCMTTRGARKAASLTTTQKLLGLYRSDLRLRREVLATLGVQSGQ